VNIEEVVTSHRDKVFIELLKGPFTKATAATLRRLRVERDLDLGLLVAEIPPAKLWGIRGALAEYDSLIDVLVHDASRQQQSVPAALLDKVGEVLDSRIRENENRVKQANDSARSWLRVWGAGTALGLGVIVGAFSWAALSNPPGWEWVTVCLAGLGVVVAGLYTFRGATDLSPLSRWLILALPLVVLGLTITLPLNGTRDVPAAAAVAAACAVTILGGLSLWIILKDPGRRRPMSRSMSTPLEIFLGQGLAEAGTDARRISLIRGELEQLLARILKEARSQRAEGRWWGATFVVVGGFAAVLSGAAGVTANQKGTSSWVAWLAIGGAGLTALATALNPGRRWEQSRTLRLACESLAQEVGVFIRVDLGTVGEAVGRTKIEEIALKYDALLGVQERSRLEPLTRK
jgi:hypothetical protein